jgi:hypothetical protein
MARNIGSEVSELAALIKNTIYIMELYNFRPYIQEKVVTSRFCRSGRFSKNAIIKQAIFHIFYCHHPGFYAIKGNL